MARITREELTPAQVIGHPQARLDDLSMEVVTPPRGEHPLQILGGSTSADVAVTGPNAWVLPYDPVKQGRWTAIRHRAATASGGC